MQEREMKVTQVKGRSPKNQIGQYVMIRKEMAARLQEEAADNHAFSSLCHILALRERSRQQLTLRNLKLVMEKEGFNYSLSQIAQTLLFLSSLGVGELDRDISGNLRSLKNIRFSLQQIGTAALANQKLDINVKKEPEAEKPKETTKVEIKIFGRTIVIDMTPEEAARYLISLIDGKKP